MIPTLAKHASCRKLRLLACAISRSAPFAPNGQTVWDLLPEFSWFEAWGYQKMFNCREVIEISERQADDQATKAELEEAYYHVWNARYSAEADTFGFDPVKAIGSSFRYAASAVLSQTIESERERLATFVVGYRQYVRSRPVELHPEHWAFVCNLIRDIFGNPFRPVTLDPRWLTSTVIDLARTIYEERVWERMPILADALMDAGCDSEEVIKHCQGPGPHVRGCWVVDLLLRKT